MLGGLAGAVPVLLGLLLRQRHLVQHHQLPQQVIGGRRGATWLGGRLMSAFVTSLKGQTIGELHGGP